MIRRNQLTYCAFGVSLIGYIGRKKSTEFSHGVANIWKSRVGVKVDMTTKAMASSYIFIVELFLIRQQILSVAEPAPTVRWATFARQVSNVVLDGHELNLTITWTEQSNRHSSILRCCAECLAQVSDPIFKHYHILNDIVFCFFSKKRMLVRKNLNFRFLEKL